MRVALTVVRVALAGLVLSLAPLGHSAEASPLPTCTSSADVNVTLTRTLTGKYSESCDDNDFEGTSVPGVGVDSPCDAGFAVPGVPDACIYDPRTTADLPAIARTLAVQLKLPPATPQFGPDPTNNEWKMLAVGFPIWLWTEGPRAKSTVATATGLTFRLSAELRSTTFAMGDGKTITCAAMTPYRSSVKPGTPSPTCGYAYSKPSLPTGRYTVTATAQWQVNWSVEGFTGSFPVSYSDSASLPIGELQALNR